MPPIVIDNKFPKVPILYLNRPERSNALSVELLRALKAQLHEFAVSDKVRGVILAGKGENFCSGLDLKEATSDEAIQEGSILLRDIFLTLSSYPKPTIASVCGNALAGGVGLACLTDLVIASKCSKFQFPEIHRGLVPAYLLVALKRRFPRPLLRAMALFCYPLSGEEAYQRGVVHQLVEECDRDEHLKKAVSLLLKGAPATQFHTKNLLEQLEEPHLADELHIAEGLHRKSRESDEAREGVAAFFEKRAPNWVSE